MLDHHMQESLSDIARLFQKLAGAMGYKTMKYQEQIKVQTSNAWTDRALDDLEAINNWRKVCDRRGIDSRGVVAIVANGWSVSTIMHSLRLTRECVRAHLRASLTIWSFWRHRCGTLEVAAQIKEARACCRPRRRFFKVPLLPVSQRTLSLASAKH
jgi:hypothetical protein